MRLEDNLSDLAESPVQVFARNAPPCSVLQARRLYPRTPKRGRGLAPLQWCQDSLDWDNNLDGGVADRSVAAVPGLLPGAMLGAIGSAADSQDLVR